jgi:Tfp pilus assembly protein PilF
MVSIAATKGKIKNHPKFVLVLGLSLLIICAIVAGALIYNHVSKTSKAAQTSKVAPINQETVLSNQAFIKGNKAQALEHAKEALTKDPNNVDNVLLVANLTKAENPSAAKQYYVQAFDTFKQQNNPDAPGKSAVTYWAAAGLAQQAGETSQAKKYYQEVIQTASPDSYQQSLAKQSQAELAGLQ